MIIPGYDDMGSPVCKGATVPAPFGASRLKREHGKCAATMRSNHEVQVFQHTGSQFYVTGYGNFPFL
jgi:hypothetical protein